MIYDRLKATQINLARARNATLEEVVERHQFVEGGAECLEEN